MKIVIDSNVFFSALIKDSIVRTILLLAKIKFFIPEYVISEFKEHEDELIAKTQYSKEEMELLKLNILQNISLIKDEQIESYMKEAKTIMDHIDKDDAPIIATALAIDADGIWSYDPHFRKQNKFKIFEASELIHEI